MKKTKHWIVICLLLTTVAISFYFLGYKISYDRIENSYTDIEIDTFYAKITDVDDTYFSVEGLSVNDINFRGEFNFNIAGEETKLEWRYTPMEISEFDIGDTIAITYSGLIQESYPAYIENVVKIKLLDDEK